MENYKRRTGGRAMAGAILIILGGLFLLDNLSYFDFGIRGYIFSWPMILIVVGLIIFLNSRDRSGLIIMGVGGVFLAGRVFDVSVAEFWPVILILFGVFILFSPKRRHHMPDIGGRVRDHFDNGDATASNEDFLDAVAIFSGSKKTINSSNFQGGKIEAIFGGFEIDLGNAKLAPGKNVLDVVTIFGGAEIFIPRDWTVVTDITPIFGGFSDKRRKDYNIVPDPERTLIIKGTCIFGGGEIKNA